MRFEAAIRFEICPSLNANESLLSYHSRKSSLLLASISKQVQLPVLLFSVNTIKSQNFCYWGLSTYIMGDILCLTLGNVTTTVADRKEDAYKMRNGELDKMQTIYKVRNKML